MAGIRVGIFAPVGPFASASEQHKVTLARIADTGVDHVCVGDHVSFFIGAGADALINATSLLTHYAELPCYVALYLLPLRHPVLVARQLASIAELAPGRLISAWVSVARTGTSLRSVVWIRGPSGVEWTSPFRSCARYPMESQSALTASFLAPRRAHHPGALTTDPADRRRAVRRRGAACGTVRRWLVGNLGLASAIQLRGRTGRRAREPCWQGPERL